MCSKHLYEDLRGKLLRLVKTSRPSVQTPSHWYSKLLWFSHLDQGEAVHQRFICTASVTQWDYRGGSEYPLIFQTPLQLGSFPKEHGGDACLIYLDLIQTTSRKLWEECWGAGAKSDLSGGVLPEGSKSLHQDSSRVRIMTEQQPITPLRGFFSCEFGNEPGRTRKNRYQAPTNNTLPHPGEYIF